MIVSIGEATFELFVDDVPPINSRFIRSRSNCGATGNSSASTIKQEEWIQLPLPLEVAIAAATSAGTAGIIIFLIPKRKQEAAAAVAAAADVEYSNNRRCNVDDRNSLLIFQVDKNNGRKMLR